MTLLLLTIPSFVIGQEEIDLETFEDQYDILSPIGAIVIDKGIFSDGLLPAPDADQVFLIDNLDEVPIFTEDCLNASNPLNCNQHALNNFVTNNIDFPTAMNLQKQESTIYVKFVLNEENKIENDIKVFSLDNPCQTCAEYAIEIMDELDQWQRPGMINGYPVKTQMILPIRYDLK